MSAELSNLVIVIRGGGEVASGVAHRLTQAHFRVCLTETSQPLAVSRGVAFCEAIYDGEKEVEGVVARHVKSVDEVHEVWHENKLPIIIDPEAKIKSILSPHVLVDAIMAKRNTGTRLTDADLVIGLGPGFQAGRDAHLVVETNNSERLGEVIFAGEAEKNTGIPIAIDGLTSERVLHSSSDGLFVTKREIGERVAAGEVIASVGRQELKAPIGGVVRALLRSGIQVKEGTKLAEIDQVASKEICYSRRARVRAIAGGVLEAILIWFNA